MSQEKQIQLAVDEWESKRQKTSPEGTVSRDDYDADEDEDVSLYFDSEGKPRFVTSGRADTAVSTSIDEVIVREKKSALLDMLSL